MNLLEIAEDIIIQNQLTSEVIDINKLLQYSLGIMICCNGEYGDVYFNPDENHVYICLGDSNPFDEKYLIDYMTQAIRKGGYENDKLIKITIENECYPNPETGNWFIFNGKDKFVKHND